MFLTFYLFCKNGFDAKMYLVQKCIFAKQRVHFTVSNVTNLFGAKMYFCKAKRTFVTFSKGKCKAKSNVQHSILATQSILLIFLFYKNLMFLLLQWCCTLLYKMQHHRNKVSTKKEFLSNCFFVFNKRKNIAGYVKMHLIPKCIWCVHFTV